MKMQAVLFITVPWTSVKYDLLNFIVNNTNQIQNESFDLQEKHDLVAIVDYLYM